METREVLRSIFASSDYQEINNNLFVKRLNEHRFVQIKLDIPENFDIRGLIVQIVDKDRGLLIATSFNFRDVAGKYYPASRPNFRATGAAIYPHLEKMGGNLEWYIEEPDAEWKQKLRESVETYYHLFTDIF